MKVVKKTGENSMVHLDVTVTTAEVSEALNNAGIQFCSQMGIHPNKAQSPAQAASEQMGIKDLDTIVNQQAIESLVPKALSKHGINPAYMPHARPKTMMRRGRTFAFELDVMPKPLYELASYEPVSFTIDPYQEDEEVIDREIGKLAEQFSQYVTDDPHPVAAGDNCLIAIEATKGGEDVSGLTTQGRTYTVGEGYMPVGFDEGLIGMDVGETRTYTFEGPGLDANNNEVMETYEVTVTVREIQKKVAPVINDEWIAKNLPMYHSLEGLREEIAKSSNEQRRGYYEDYKRNFAASELAKRFDGSIPDEVYEGARFEVMRTLRQQAQSQGLKWEQFVEQQGGEQQVSMMIMLETRQQLIQGFSLDAYYRHFNLSFTEGDLEEVCRQINPRNPKAARQQMESAGLSYALRESAERLAAVKHLVERADITVKDQA